MNFTCMLYDLNSCAVSLVKLCAFVLDRCASAVVQMATLQCGTFTTRHWCASSKVTQMVHHVLTFLQMEPNYGQVDQTILSDLGISEKAGSYSSMTFHHRSFLWATVRLASGLLLAWRTPMLKFCMQPNLTSTSYTSTSLVFCLSALLHVESGLFQLVKTTFSMPGGHLMGHLYSRLVYKATNYYPVHVFLLVCLMVMFQLQLQHQREMT